MGTWRDHATPIIRRVLEETKGQTEKEIRRALQKAYPYGVRRHHPYKIWLDEIQRQLGKKPPLGMPWATPAPGQLALPINQEKEEDDGDENPNA
jgi:hypothetical protein